MLERADLDTIWDLMLQKLEINGETPKNFLGSVESHKKLFDAASDEVIENMKRITETPDKDLI